MPTDFTAVATQLINDELGSGMFKVDSGVYDWAVAQVAKRLGEIEKLTNGIVQYGPDGETSFLSSDPLKPVRTVLGKYKGLGATG